MIGEARIDPPHVDFEPLPCPLCEVATPAEFNQGDCHEHCLEAWHLARRTDMRAKMIRDRYHAAKCLLSVARTFSEEGRAAYVRRVVQHVRAHRDVIRDLRGLGVALNEAAE